MSFPSQIKRDTTSDLAQKYRHISASHRQAGDGREIQVEVREDEEQSVKLQEIIDILVAAGYFRARIKGLSPFDKVVGGMTWCIESLSVDVDVDLLFQENSTIGQKIALTEKIVAVLPKIKCPHRIEPHQIQGLDFIHIFPIIQWLVKVSMEARQEKSALVRSYAVGQYEKDFPSTHIASESRQMIGENINLVEDLYRPRRYYKRKTVPPPDLTSRVQITLLEYGFRGGEKSKQLSTEDDTNQREQDRVENNDQLNIDKLLANLVINQEEDAFIDTDFTEEEKTSVLQHYRALHSELKHIDGVKTTREEEQLVALEEHRKLLDLAIARLKDEQNTVENRLKEEEDILKNTRLIQDTVNKTLLEFAEEEKKNPNLMKETEELVILSNKLKNQEISFKENCRKEMSQLQKEIEEFKLNKSPVKLTPEEQKQIEEYNENLRNLKLQLAKKNQIVAKLQRQLDDVPSRAEMAQYQRRFLELYNQVGAKHKETKQYYTLFNTLEDKKRYMQKQLSLLNSVAENYPEAIASPAGKEEFLKQFQNIVEGVRANRFKMEKRLAEEKRKKDSLSESLQNLLDLQRAYATVVRQLTWKCKEYENLLSCKNNSTNNGT